MATGDNEATTVCSRCGIEVGLGRVCPKCHSRASLVSHTANADAPAGRSLWLVWIGLGLVVVGGLGAAVWWALKRADPAPPERDPGPKAAATTPGARPSQNDRVFGRPPPPRRVDPAPPPKVCGHRYELTVRMHFPKPAPGPAAMARPAPKRRPTPERLTTRQTFLIARQGAALGWVILSTRRELTMAKRTLPLFQLDAQGALLPDRKRRRMMRRGPHDRLPSGARPSDLVGRVVADLSPGAPRGVALRRMRRSEPWIRGLVTDALAVIRWLAPRPPRAGARVYVDDRPPPDQAVPRCQKLRRRFRRLAKGPSANVHRYSLSTAGAGARITGYVDQAPGQLLPAGAHVTLTRIPPGKPAVTKIELTLEGKGRGCNR